MKMTRILTLVTVLAALTVVYAAPKPSYNRNAELQNHPNATSADLPTTRNCQPDGTGTFSYSTTGTMDNGNTVTSRGTVTISLDRRTPNLHVVTSLNGSWVESDPVDGDIQGTFQLTRPVPNDSFCFVPPGLTLVTGYSIHVLPSDVTFRATLPTGVVVKGRGAVELLVQNFTDQDGTTRDNALWFQSWVTK
jgi:hypothetical protein